MKEKEAENQWEPDQIRSADLLIKIDHLLPGETLYITHAGLIKNINGFLIAFDPPNSFGKKFFLEPKTLIPPINKNNFPFSPAIRKYPFHLYDQEPQQVAADIGSRLQYIFITHMDNDHFRARDLMAMIKANPRIQIFVPPEFISQLARYNRDIPPNFHTLIPKSTALRESHVPPGLNHTYPNWPDQSQVIIGAETPDQQITVTSFETPHIGGSKSPFVQSLMIDTGQGRQLVIADCAFSPELISLVQEQHTQKPISQIDISVAKFDLSSFYWIFRPRFANWYRHNFEELYRHSVYILPALCLATRGSTTFNIIHRGEFHSSHRDLDSLPKQLGDWSNQNPGEWLEEGNDFLSGLLAKPNLEKLVPFTGYRYDTKKSLKRYLIRYHFSHDFQRWIKTRPMPGALAGLFTMPGPNEVLHSWHLGQT